MKTADKRAYDQKGASYPLSLAPSNLYIKKYCHIKRGKCRVNGNSFFRAETGDIKEFLSGLYRATGADYPKFFKMDILSKAGFLAAELLLWDVNIADGQRTGLFFANSSSSLDTDMHYQETIGDSCFPSPSVFVYTLPNIVLGEICIRHKIYGENIFFVNNGFRPEQLYRYAASAFLASELEQALVGWLECCGEECDVFVMLVGWDRDGVLFTEDHINLLK